VVLPTVDVANGVIRHTVSEERRDIIERSLQHFRRNGRPDKFFNSAPSQYL